MSFRWSRWLYSFLPPAVVVGSMLATPVSGQSNGAEEAFRVWTDASGQHKSEAQLLNVKDGMVRLKKPSGQVITVPVDRLSEADRRYLAGLAAAGAAERDRAIDRAKSAVVLVSQEFTSAAGDDGETASRVFSLPGVLLLRDKLGGYVLGSRIFYESIAGPSFYDEGKQPPSVRVRVTLEPGTPRERQVAAQLLGKVPDLAVPVFRIPGENLPPPVEFGDEMVLGKDSAPVSVVGIPIRSRKGPCLVKETQINRPSRIRFTGDHLSGFVIDHTGRVIGITEGLQDYSRGIKGIPITRVSQFLSRQDPQLVHLRMWAEKWDASGIQYGIFAQIEDPFGRVAAQPELLLTRTGATAVADEAPPVKDRSTASRLPDRPAERSPEPDEMDCVAIELPRPSAHFGRVYWREQTVGSWKDQGDVTGGKQPQYLVRFRFRLPDGTTTVTDAVRPEVLFAHSMARGKIEPRTLPAAYVFGATPHRDGELQLTQDVPAQDAPNAATMGITMPKPVAIDLPLTATVQDLSGVRLTTLEPLPAAEDVADAAIEAVWSRDSKSAFLVHANGIVQKWDFPECRRVARLALPGKIEVLGRCQEARCSGMSREGLVVVTEHGPEEGRLWVIDEANMQVKHVVQVSGTYLAVSPASSLAFVFQPVGIEVVDLAQGRLASRTARPRKGHAPYLFAAPDGNHLLATNWRGLGNVLGVWNLRVAGHHVFLDDAHLAYNREFIAEGEKPKAPNAKRTALIDACRNPTNEFAMFETRIKKAARSIRAGGRRIIAGIDPQTRNYYVKEGSMSPGQMNMMVFSPSGRMLWRGPMSTDYLLLHLHPKGRAGIVYGRSVAWIEFPEKFEPLARTRPDRVPMDLAEGIERIDGIDGSDGVVEIDGIEKLENFGDGSRRGPALDD